jgi:glycosyltransferase involved in cell wall biosynthesis
MRRPTGNRGQNRPGPTRTRLTTSNSPLLSVCVPVYNGERYLEESLNSVLSQDFTAFELVVVDDCSTDESAAIIAHCKDHRLRTCFNEQRLGLVGNWNRCLELSRGRFVTLFHQDDVMQPHNLKRKVELLERCPKAGMAFSDVKITGADGRVQTDHWFCSMEPNSDKIISGMDFFVRLILGFNLVCCSSVIVRKECFTRLGTFDPRLPFTADWEMWLRIALHFDVAYLETPLVHYRLHDSNETRSFTGIRELEQEFRAKRIALDREPEHVPNSRALRSRVCQALETRALRMAAERQLPPDDKKECRMLAAEMRRFGGIVGIHRVFRELQKQIGKITFLAHRIWKATLIN